MAHADNIRTLLRDVLARRGFNHPKIDINPITTGGGNYTSALYLVTVTGKEELKLFVKVAVVGEKLRQIMNAATLYSTEQIVYNYLVRVFGDLEEKNGVESDDRFVFPEYFGCNPEIGEETVVLEDLVAKGCYGYSRFKSVDWEHASNAVKTLAKFHALSFAYQKDNPRDFGAVIEKLKYIHHDRSEDENLKATWMKMIEGALQVIKNDEHKEKMKKFLLDPNGKDFMVKFKAPLGAVVLAHGDYRTSNLLFKKNGKVQTIPVDYQTVHSGCPVTDLLYFIFLGTDEEFRRDHYEELVDFYHKELCAALERLNVDVNEVYPREMYEEELKEMLPCVLRMTMVILPVVTVDAEHAPKVAGDADLDDFAVTPNELFARRFTGVVNDCVRWGVI